MFTRSILAAASASACLTFVAPRVEASLTFTNYTTGLGSTNVQDVYAVGGTVYAATWGGLGVSTNGGTTFTTYTTADGLGSNLVMAVYADGGVVYAATLGGLSIAGAAPVSGGGVAGLAAIALAGLRRRRR